MGGPVLRYPSVLPNTTHDEEIEDLFRVGALFLLTVVPHSSSKENRRGY